MALIVHLAVEKIGMPTAPEPLLTADEYLLLPALGRPSELVRGRVVLLDIPTPQRGYYCSQVGFILSDFVRQHASGRVCTRSGIITERNPDTVRGGDVSYYSYTRLPTGRIPEGYLGVAPELVFEVRSPADRWSRILRKVSEYLDVGVVYVCVLDPRTKTLTVYNEKELLRVLTDADELTLPNLFGGGFRVPVSSFFAD